MERKVFEKIDMTSYGLAQYDYVIAVMLKNYLETLSVDDAREILEKIFTSNTDENGTTKVSAPELAALIRDAQTKTENESKDWHPDQSEPFIGKIMELIRSMLPDSLNATEYVKAVPYGLIDMLHDCYKAIESATGIYRFK